MAIVAVQEVTIKIDGNLKREPLQRMILSPFETTKFLRIN
jgi:hypothetical protein